MRWAKKLRACTDIGTNCAFNKHMSHNKNDLHDSYTSKHRIVTIRYTKWLQLAVLWSEYFGTLFARIGFQSVPKPGAEHHTEATK